MESLMRAVEDGAAGGEYFPLRNVDEHEHENDIGSGDDARLKQLGYKRELSRSLSEVRDESSGKFMVGTLLGAEDDGAWMMRGSNGSALIEIWWKENKLEVRFLSWKGNVEKKEKGGRNGWVESNIQIEGIEEGGLRLRMGYEDQLVVVAIVEEEEVGANGSILSKMMKSTQGRKMSYASKKHSMATGNANSKEVEH
ncbi:hypothetical protein EZV62_018614 [Acer yangbiense]|uniref:Uncharacterized protein n=1 Tax=Acer yangbiense TaxID=1000413 RepID=A0A5C7HJV9_9ROSI|nr:hypothetical protein EZV62_018614 [Acer yangbiense]